MAGGGDGEAGGAALAAIGALAGFGADGGDFVGFAVAVQREQDLANFAAQEGGVAGGKGLGGEDGFGGGAIEAVAGGFADGGVGFRQAGEGEAGGFAFLWEWNGFGGDRQGGQERRRRQGGAGGQAALEQGVDGRGVG